MEWITLAHLLRPQGRKGELLAELLTDFPEQLAGRTGMHLAPVGFTGTAEQARPCTITETWMPHGRNEGRIVLSIAGVTSIADAEQLAGFDLLVAPEHRAPLEDGAAYISDLIGCSLFDREQLVGIVQDVEFPTSPDGRRRLDTASPLLVVRLNDSNTATLEGSSASPEGGETPEGSASLDSPGAEALIPFTRAFLRSFDPAAKILRMDLPEGLIDLPHPAGPSTT